MLAAQRATAPATRLLSTLRYSRAASSTGSLQHSHVSAYDAWRQAQPFHCAAPLPGGIGGGTAATALYTAWRQLRRQHMPQAAGVSAVASAASVPGSSRVWSSVAALDADGWTQLRTPSLICRRSSVADSHYSGSRSSTRDSSSSSFGKAAAASSSGGGSGSGGASAAPTNSSSQQPGEPRSGSKRPGADAVEARAKARRIAPLVGVAAGVFGSLVGVGGGVLIVPAIIGACPGVSQRVVSGSSLVAVLATAAAATKTYSAASVIDPSAAALIGAAAVCTAPLGARLTTRLDAKALRRILGGFLVAVALLVPLKALLLLQLDPGGGAAAAAGAWDPTWALPPPGKSAFYAATGALAGCATGLLGIGGGTVVTPLLAAAGGMPQAAVLGTALLAMLPPSTVALAQHARLGNVDWRLAAGLAAGAALGSWVGSLGAVSAPPGVLEAAFCIGMLLLGVKTLRSGRPRRR